MLLVGCRRRMCRLVWERVPLCRTPRMFSELAIRNTLSDPLTARGQMTARSWIPDWRCPVPSSRMPQFAPVF